MPVSGGYVEPIIKVLIYGVIIGIFTFIWSALGMTFSSGHSLMGEAVGIMALFSVIIFSVIGLFIGAVITLIISAILSGSTDYEANVRVVASLMVISVIQSVFTFLDGVNLYLAAVVNILISLWGLYMAYYALVETLKAKEKGSKILIIVFAVLMIIGTFSGIAAKKVLQNMDISVEQMEESIIE